MIHWITSPGMTAKKQTKKDSFRIVRSVGRSLMATTTIMFTFVVSITYSAMTVSKKRA